MQIILLEKVVNLGNLGEVVKVKDGYARNFLLPHGLAIGASEGAVAQAAAMRNQCLNTRQATSPRDPTQQAQASTLQRT